jgi:hypothetical protein
VRVLQARDCLLRRTGMQRISEVPFESPRRAMI